MLGGWEASPCLSQGDQAEPYDRAVCNHLVSSGFTPFHSHLHKFVASALILCKPLVSLVVGETQAAGFQSSEEICSQCGARQASLQGLGSFYSFTAATGGSHVYCHLPSVLFCSFANPCASMKSLG